MPHYRVNSSSLSLQGVIHIQYLNLPNNSLVFYLVPYACRGCMCMLQHLCNLAACTTPTHHKNNHLPHSAPQLVLCGHRALLLHVFNKMCVVKVLDFTVLRWGEGFKPCRVLTGRSLCFGHLCLLLRCVGLLFALLMTQM